MPILDRVAADLPVTLKTASYALAENDTGTEIQFDSASAVDAYLPPVNLAPNGYNVILRNVGEGTLTITPASAETIDGASSASLSTGGWQWIRNDGTEWKTVASNAATIADGSVTIAKLADAAKPYDFSFVAGYDQDMVLEDIAVQNYGELVIARSLTIEGEVGYIDTPATGQAAIVDIEKNGATIYSSKPQFAASANTLTAGTLSTTSLSSGDRLTFAVTQIGSTEPGEGVRFTLKCRLA